MRRGSPSAPTVNFFCRGDETEPPGSRNCHRRLICDEHG